MRLRSLVATSLSILAVMAGSAILAGQRGPVATPIKVYKTPT